MLLDAWLPIFRLYGDSSPPSFHDFQRRFRQHFPKHCHFADVPNSVDCTREVLRRAKTNTAFGVCGWRVAELKALPDAILGMLCQVLDLIEATGHWPEALRTGIVSMIPKEGGGSAANKMRPISVMSTIYRLWAACKCQQVILWQEGWAYQRRCLAFGMTSAVRTPSGRWGWTLRKP